MLPYLLLLLLSTLAPRGLDAVQATPTADVHTVAGQASKDEAVYHQAPAHHSQFPDCPVEVEEEELRECKGADVHPAVVLRCCLAYLSGLLAHSPFLVAPPQILRQPKLEPTASTPRTILHRSLLI